MLYLVLFLGFLPLRNFQLKRFALFSLSRQMARILCKYQVKPFFASDIVNFHFDISRFHIAPGVCGVLKSFIRSDKGLITRDIFLIVTYIILYAILSYLFFIFRFTVSFFGVSFSSLFSKSFISQCLNIKVHQQNFPYCLM